MKLFLNFFILFCLMTANAQNIAIRSSIFHFKSDPEKSTDAYEYFEDGLMIVEDGLVKSVGNYEDLKDEIQNFEFKDYSGKLVMPGFVDGHIHFPQTEMIASHGEELMQWLDNYTFPTEGKFKDKTHSREVAKFFLNQLLKNGTTTALVFGTVHKESVDAFFEEAEKLNLRMIAGKVMMDRNAPEYLLDTPKSSYEDSKKLITNWHGKGRLQYAVTPRFAITSTEKQLAQAKRLLEEFPDVYLHTHLSENKAEIEFTKSLFPEADSYLDVYKNAGLFTEKTVFAHSIHLTDNEWKTLESHDCSIAFCPTSNLFLGSGLFNLQKAAKHNLRVAFGTDVGAGTSFSILETMNEAYKVTQLRKAFETEPESVLPLSTLKSFYLATLGGAKALHLDEFIGNFETGKEADFVVLDLQSTDLLKFRLQQCKTLEERLFVLQILGDDRSIFQTYIKGKPVLN
ncbi:MAG: guanine deaminase [Psychroflexus sp.]